MTGQNTRIAVWMMMVLLFAPLASGASSFQAGPADDPGSGGPLSAVLQTASSVTWDDQGVTSDWWAHIQQDLRQSEYNVTWQERTYLSDVLAAYQAPNRAHNLRTYFTPAGLFVIPRTWAEEIETPPWRIGIALADHPLERLERSRPDICRKSHLPAVGV
jgi:hypothetical protein